ncbi:penicillin-binding protein [Georgenia yuyongxinii]|uniref:Penicillin-binding protein n=1 Tax=Georgenia yuyongxinii TaxID=2589797 RepID=A0A5B8C7G5_9MICO|nr:transglycosylase domain-containing protein [Georgenia yuyongxinii]QDC26398.1 penicillin-binding protein [Georgenia yuyongxinii]
MLGTILTGIAAVLGVFVFAYATTDVPAPDDFALAEATTVYYADGETPMGSFAEFDRESVPLDSLPEHVSAAIIASEDSGFYENNGVDPKGLVRALWNNLRGLPTQGGSTLTQQYVERYYTGTTTSYLGKFNETILALKIDRSQSKETILENYLNTIYFGRGAYGIEKAAQAYFDKPAAELSISESALIAGIIPSPSRWDPAVNPERAEQRWNRVLDLMVQDGWIDQGDRDAAVYPTAIDRNTENTYGGPTGYLLTMVREELVNRAGMTEEQIDTRGLDIVTTIDQRSQDAAVQAVDNLPDDRPENNKVSLVSIDPATGGIVALYGGPDYVSQPRNAATQDRAQAGSTFKPFTLISALEQGASLYDTYQAPARLDIGDWTVRNFDGRGLGRINLIEATENSVNTVYGQLNEEYGPQKTLEAAVRAGVPQDTPGLTADISNVLGPASPTSLEMATAFATFASQGVRHDSFIVDAVRDAAGNTVYTGGGQGEREFDEQVTADATFAMQAVVEDGSAARSIGNSLGGRPVAGKTGTSTGQKSANFGGYVPQLATFVNMYQVGPDGSEESLTGFGDVSTVFMGGGQYPARIWRDYMVGATEGMPVEDFPEPSARPRRPVAPPVEAPTTEVPTEEPTTETPTPEPTTEAPTEEPTTEAPTEAPTEVPTEPTTPQPGGPTPGQQTPPVAPPAGTDTQGQGRWQDFIGQGRDRT